MKSTELVDILRATPFGAGLARRYGTRLADLAELRKVDAGDVIFSEGDATPGLGIVRSGRVALRLQVPGRGPVTVLTVEAGDLLGWSAVVAPYRSTSTATAAEPTEVVMFDARGLRALLDDDEELAAVIYPRILRAVARRLEATRLQLLDLFGTGGELTW